MAVSIILIAYLTLCLQHWILYIGSIFSFKQLAYTLYIYMYVYSFHCVIIIALCVKVVWDTFDELTIHYSSPLSLYTYIYIHLHILYITALLSLSIHIYIYIYIYIYICIEREGRAVMLQRYEIPLMNWLYITALLSLSIHICIHTSTYITINPL